MTDYLELLLELLEEPEEKEYALTAQTALQPVAGTPRPVSAGPSDGPEGPAEGADGTPAHAARGAARAVCDTEGAGAPPHGEEQESPWRSARTEPESPWYMARTGLENLLRTARTDPAPEPRGADELPQPVPASPQGAYRADRPGDLPARAVESAREVLAGGGVSGLWRSGTRIPAQYPLAPPAQRAAGAAVSDSAAAALERRLARSAAWAAPPPRTQGSAEERDAAGAGLGLEELDRRVRRDARRYDGILTPY